MLKNLNSKAPFREDHLKGRREGGKKKKKINWSLLRLIIDFIFNLFNLLRYYFQEKTILSVSVLIIVVGVPAIVIPRVTSKDPPTPPPESGVNPEVQVNNSDELTLEEPKDIQEGAESGTQSTEDRHLSEELKDIRERVESGTQDMEDMRKSVKSMDEDAQKMIKKVKKMKEELDGQSEN